MPHAQAIRDYPARRLAPRQWARTLGANSFIHWRKVNRVERSRSIVLHGKQYERAAESVQYPGLYEYFRSKGAGEKIKQASIQAEFVDIVEHDSRKFRNVANNSIDVFKKAAAFL